MIYREQLKIPSIHFVNDDYKNQLEAVKAIENVVVVTDPPFNIGYHYDGYKDKMDDTEYMNMLTDILKMFPAVIIHYPEELHKLSVYSQKIPKKVVSWVYNSNTAKQHRDIAYYDIEPVFNKAWQPYKNPKDKRILERMANGSRGVECMIGGMLTK